LEFRIVSDQRIDLVPEDALEDALLRRLAEAKVELIEPEPLAKNA
jgi:hypothetical protein